MPKYIELNIEFVLRLLLYSTKNLNIAITFPLEEHFYYLIKVFSTSGANIFHKTVNLLFFIDVLIDYGQCRHS